MGKEDLRSLFREQLDGFEKERVKEEVEIKRLEEEERREQRRLISQFDNLIKPDLERAERAFLQREPMASILELLEEVALAIKQREGKKTVIIKKVIFNLELGRHTMGEQLNPTDEVKLKFTRTINDGGSVGDSIIGVDINFDEPNVRIPISFHASVDSNTVRLTFGNSFYKIGLDEIDPKSFSSLLATKVSGGRYRYFSSTPSNHGVGMN